MSTPSFLAYCGSRACSASTKAARPPAFLGLGDDLQCNGGLAGRFRAEDFGDAAARHAADAERGVEGDGAGRDDGDGDDGLFAAEAHDGTLAELLFNLRKRQIYGALTIICATLVLHSGHFLPVCGRPRFRLFFALPGSKSTIGLPAFLRPRKRKFPAGNGGVISSSLPGFVGTVFPQAARQTSRPLAEATRVRRLHSPQKKGATPVAPGKVHPTARSVTSKMHWR